jgi:hypothetical protein
LCEFCFEVGNLFEEGVALEEPTRYGTFDTHGSLPL